MATPIAPIPQNPIGECFAWRDWFKRISLLATTDDDTLTVKSLSGNPTTSDLSVGTWGVYKNTTTGDIRVWVNDGGTMKSGPLAVTGPILW